jgi:hypothetical protein
MKTIYIAVLAILIYNGCKNDDNQYVVTEIKYLRNSELFNCSECNCFSISNIYSRNGFVIRDKETYDKYADSLRIFPVISKINCDTAQLMNIDFNKHSLIGISAGYGACDSINRNIYVDNKNQKVIYQIGIKEYNGVCIQIYLLSLNLVLIPRIPDNYKVYFKVYRN